MKQAIYRAAISCMPPRIQTLEGSGLDARHEQALLNILRHHRCIGGAFHLFDLKQSRAAYHFGLAGRARPVQGDTQFRIASISKMVTALCVLKLAQEGSLSLDEDTGLVPGSPITLRQLMSHTAGIQDGEAYIKGLQEGTELKQVLAASFQKELQGQWAYSNLGAGAIACVLEEAFNQSFECIMQEGLFKPLNVQASFYPQRVLGDLADARRVFPPQRRPGFDAQARRQKVDASMDVPDPARHYGLAQGNCCLSAAQLQRLMKNVMHEGYLNQESLQLMREAVAPFGRGQQCLTQGLGLFGLADANVHQGTLYGHQGKAYGAVHAAFFDPMKQRGMIFLSTGISEARKGFLADAVCDLLRFSFQEEVWA